MPLCFLLRLTGVLLSCALGSEFAGLGFRRFGLGWSTSYVFIQLWVGAQGITTARFVWESCLRNS